MDTVSTTATMFLLSAALIGSAPTAGTAATAANVAPPSSSDTERWPGMSPSAFEERVTTILTERLGETFTDAGFRWISCPPEGARYAKEWGDHDVACQGELGDRTTRTAIRVMFHFTEPGWSPTPEPMTYSYRADGPFEVASRNCDRRPHRRHLQRAGHRLTAFRTHGGWDGCEAASSMLDRVVARRLRGPMAFALWSDSAFEARAFPQRYRFTCRRTGSVAVTVHCRNQVGHGFRARLQRQ